MINISEDYKNRIISMFGPIGEEWIGSIPSIIDKYVNKFNLKNIKVLDSLTYNVLLFAECDEFGKIVMKIEIPFKEMTIRESEALKINNGACTCICFYSDIDDGVIILERLFPGTNLNDVKDIEKRIDIFSEVSKKFNTQVDDKMDLPTYREIFNRSFEMAMNDDKFNAVHDLMVIANQVYSEIESNNDSNYLLHSDLYADNILLTDNGWKTIDPHGFIGEKILDSAIFAQKELEKTDFNQSNVLEILGLMNKYCEFSEFDLCKALFVNYVLNICWDIEVNLGDEHTKECVERANTIYNCFDTYINDNSKQLKKMYN